MGSCGWIRQVNDVTQYVGLHAQLVKQPKITRSSNVCFLVIQGQQRHQSSFPFLSPPTHRIYTYPRQMKYNSGRENCWRSGRVAERMESGREMVLEGAQYGGGMKWRAFISRNGMKVISFKWIFVLLYQYSSSPLEMGCPFISTAVSALTSLPPKRGISGVSWYITMHRQVMVKLWSGQR